MTTSKSPSGSPRPPGPGRGTAPARGAGAPGRPVSTHPVRDPSGLAPGMRTRRAVMLVLATMIVPGSAQVVAGSRRLGRAALRVWLSVIGALVLALVVGVLDRSIILGLITRSWFLLLLVVALVALAAGWLVLMVDAWRLARPASLAGRSRGVLAAVTAVAVLLTSGTLIFSARQVMAGRDLVQTVFGGNTKTAAVDGRYNVLLLGGDAGRDRVGLRPDSMTLVSIDATTGRSILFSFPRNMQNVPFPTSSPMHAALPHGFDCGDTCLLNAVYTYATEHKGIYGPSVKDPGAQATMDAVEGITGLTVNYYVLIDLKGFQHLIDAVGGITLDVNRRVPIGGGSSRITGWIEPGKDKHLDGYHALWFARSREGSSDYDRMARQRCVMTAMLQQVNPQTVLLKFRSIAEASAQVVSTSIPESQLGDFVSLALKAKQEKVTSVQFVPPVITPARPDFGRVRQLVDEAIAQSEKAGGGTAGGSTKTGSTKTGSTKTGSSNTGSTSGSSSSGGSQSGVTVDAKAVCQAQS